MCSSYTGPELHVACYDCRGGNKSSTAHLGTTANLTAEISIQKAVGDGIMFTPGLVYSRGSDRNLLSLCCRSELHF